MVQNWLMVYYASIYFFNDIMLLLCSITGFINEYIYDLWWRTWLGINTWLCWSVWFSSFECVIGLKLNIALNSTFIKYLISYPPRRVFFLLTKLICLTLIVFNISIKNLISLSLIPFLIKKCVKTLNSKQNTLFVS